MKGLFITGTGTGVGKTLVTATLTRAMTLAGRDVIALKPFVSGIDDQTHWKDNDPLLLSAAMNGKYPPEVISQVQLKLPLSPYDAARLSNTEIDIESVVKKTKSLAARHEFHLIEGAGGVEVPITEDATMGDFIAMFDIPALIVSRTDLGTINHTIMTVNALRRRHITVAGVIFIDHHPVATNEESDFDCIVGPETATHMAKVNNLGTIPYITHLTSQTILTINNYLNHLPIDHPSIVKILSEFN